MKFRGHAHRSLDDKGRLVLPPDFRDLIRTKSSGGAIVLTYWDKHVIGITPEQWTLFEAELESIKAPSRALQNAIRLLNSVYTEVAVGKLGRIAIPANLRKSGKLEKDVVILGAGRRFEIWSAESYEQLLEEDYDVSGELIENNVTMPF